MRFIVLTLSFLFFSLGQPALADKLPNEVMEPYKQYQAATKKGDSKNAYKFAQKAWQAAEEELGDHKTTGDLAENFASLATNWNDSGNVKRAFERAIQLSSFYGDDEVEMRVLRRIKYMTWLTGEEGKKPTFDNQVSAAREDLEKINMSKSTYNAEITFLEGRRKLKFGHWKDALELYDQSIAQFEAAEDGIPSLYKYLAPLDRADVLVKLDRKIPAALEYQKVMQNQEGVLPAEHPYIKRAFGDWMSLRYEFEENGELESAENAGLCKCWPFEEYESKVTPLKRVPPIMPREAQRSGHVYVMFDVTDNGRTENIRVIKSTQILFESEAKKAVSKWQYSPKSESSEEEPKARKDISSKITFMLSDEYGNVIPELK